MDTYYAALTVPQLRERILADDPARKGLSKLRKGELIALLRELESERAEDEAQLDDNQHNAKQANPDMTGHWADVDPEDAQVFQGAMHEAGEDTIGRLMRQAVEQRRAEQDLAASATRTAEALNTAGLNMQKAAQKLAAVAWAHQVAVVRSMGRTVRGTVIDTVLRTPDATGGRVLLVVEHPNGTPSRKATRTLHRLTDVKFEALAS